MDRITLVFATLLVACTAITGVFSHGTVYAYSGFQDAQEGSTKRTPDPAPCGLELVYVGGRFVVVNSCSGDVVFIG